MDKQSLIESFKSFTGASDEESKFFLEANAWNLEVATSAFMDSEDVSEHRPAAQPAQPPAPTQSTPANKPKPAAGGRGGVATFRDIANREQEEDSDGDDDVEKYYAGGQKSGQMIHYPKEPGKGGKKDIVGDVFESAKQQGGKPAEETQKATPSYFTGSGFKLGDNVTKSTVVKPAAAPEGARQEVQRVITFWRNGFTIDNGPLRALTDPANEAFLQDIQKGLVPRELEQSAPKNSNFSVNLVDNRAQEYQEPPKPKVAAFSGSGNTLGSTPSTTTTTTTAQKPAATPASSSFQVDETQPTTSIQLRLADGTRLVAKFNHHHTVGDIRRFVDMAKRGTQAYHLKTTFPPKVLGDNSQTIAEAGLVNAVIVQQYA